MCHIIGNIAHFVGEKFKVVWRALIARLVFEDYAVQGLADARVGCNETLKQVSTEGHGSPDNGVEVTRPNPTVNRGWRALSIWVAFNWSKPFGPIWLIDVGMVRVPCGDPVIRLFGSLLLLKLA